MAWVAAVAEVAKMGESVNSTFQERLSANDKINLEQKEAKIQYQQKTIANYDQTTQVIDAQEAAASTRGYSMDSPTLQAVQIDTVNKGGAAQKNIDISQSINEANTKIEKQNVQNMFYASLFGSGASGASNFASEASSRNSK